MIDFSQWSEANFRNLCQGILKGLGIKGGEFPSQGAEQALRVELVRKSTDGMFRTDEKWLCLFARPGKPLTVEQVQPLVQAAITADVGYLLLVIFGVMTDDAAVELRETLAKEKVHVVLLTGSLAETLAVDYGQAKEWHSLATPTRFSFAHLRKQVQIQVETAPWRKHFQTASIQPVRLLPLHPADEALTEADLVRALGQGSFLLLGEPGTGKTTALLAFAEILAAAGGRTPAFLPLGSYQGDFWNILGEALAPGSAPVPKAIAQALVASGGLVLMLDGINEVQDADLQQQLVAELNHLTAPDEATAHSLWIVSGRVHDYEQSRYRLDHLESCRWEMQPFTADLIYRFLADALGEAHGKALYHDLGDAVRQICANPLLLTMLLTVYQETGKAPVGHGALYHQFVELLLCWGKERGLNTSEKQTLEALLPEPLTDERYQALAQEALTALAAAMSTTMIQWEDAYRQFASTLGQAHNPGQAAGLLLEDLTRRGLLRRGVFNRVRFFHHTLQEYFQARQLIGHEPDELIPRQGVPPARRETVIFLAGLLPDPTPLVRRALDVDLSLAFEMVHDASQAAPPALMHQLVKQLWSLINNTAGIATGYRRRQALMFRRLATLLGQTVEALALPPISFS